MLSMTCACGSKKEEIRFEQALAAFCTDISAVDTMINHIDSSSENATADLLNYLDTLNTHFASFGELDFPKTFDYLEPMAQEAASYMEEAVKSYHDLYQDADTYDEKKAAYAKENYSRAYKRIQTIIAFLQGKDPNDTLIQSLGFGQRYLPWRDFRMIEAVRIFQSVP